jgi:hypothetical protein
MASIGEKITRTIAKAAFVTGEQSGGVAVARCAQGLACAMLAVADRRHRVPRASTSRPTPLKGNAAPHPGRWLDGGA